MNLGNPIATGNTAKIYHYKNQIIKIFHEYLPDTESSYEAYKQNFAYSCGLPVPKVLNITKIDGKQAIVMEYIEGRTLGDLCLENKQAEYYMNIAIDVQQKVHTLIVDSFEPMLEKLRRQIESVQNLDKRKKSFLLNKLESITFTNRLCHGDFHLFNLIMADNQEVTIIDWVDSSSGDIRADVYRTYLLYSQYSTKFADMYLRLYCEKSGLFMDEILQWAPIIAGARLSESVSSEKSERLMDIINHYFL